MEPEPPMQWALLTAGTLPSPGGLGYEESFWTTRQRAGVANLPSVESEQWEEFEGHATTWDGTLTLMATSLGTGLLALPFAFAAAGPALGMALLALFAVWSGLASFLLCQSCEWARCFSYEEVMAAAFGRWGAVLMEVAVIWLLLGAMTSLLVVAGDSLVLLLAACQLPAQVWLDRQVLVALDLLLVVPLSLAPSAQSLRLSNAVAVTCTATVAAILAARGLTTAGAGLTSGLAPGLASVAGGSAVHSTGRVLQAVPIIMLSLGCQVQVPCVYVELQDRSLRTATRVLAAVATACFTFYTAVALAGLVAAGALQHDVEVKGNVLDSFPAGDGWALAMRAAMGLSVTLVYPMLCLPCRSTVDHLLFGGGAGQPSRGRWPHKRHAAETAAIVCVTYWLAVRGSDLAHVFGLTGATAGALICYLLPAASYLALRRGRSGRRQDSTRATALLAALTLALLTPLSALLAWQEWRG